MLPTIQICGNLKRMETKHLPSGKQMTKFQLECSEKNSKGEWTNLYISGEVWEKSSEFVNKYFKDGSAAIVTGKLYTNMYEKQDGTKVYENKFLFPNIGFAAKDRVEVAPTPGLNQNSTYQQPQNQQQMPTIDMDSEEIPF
jgi:single-stranded DNA-binding protein